MDEINTLIKIRNKKHALERKGFCCYCEQSFNIKREMTYVPRDYPEVLQKWVDILGGTFLKNVNSKRSQSYICKSHFKQTWKMNRPIRALPFANLGRPDIIPDNENDMKKSDKDQSKCSYCEKMEKIINMTSVTKHEFYFNKWVKILGERFRENVEESTEDPSMICKSHFEDLPPNRSRPLKLLPIPMEMPETRMKIEKKDEPNMLQCCYCSKVRNNLNEMTKIPKERRIVLRWAEILGPMFEENLMKRKQRYLCWEHFKFRKMRVFNDEIMEDFRRRQILKEHEKNVISNNIKEEIEMNEEIKIEKDIKMEVVEELEYEVKPMELKEIKQEIQN